MLSFLCKPHLTGTLKGQKDFLLSWLFSLCPPLPRDKEFERTSMHTHTNSQVTRPLSVHFACKQLTDPGSGHQTNLQHLWVTSWPVSVPGNPSTPARWCVPCSPCNTLPEIRVHVESLGICDLRIYPRNHCSFTSPAFTSKHQTTCWDLNRIQRSAGWVCGRQARALSIRLTMKKELRRLEADLICGWQPGRAARDGKRFRRL